MLTALEGRLVCFSSISEWVHSSPPTPEFSKMFSEKIIGWVQSLHPSGVVIHIKSTTLWPCNFFPPFLP
jgi:hypothetical protein